MSFHTRARGARYVHKKTISPCKHGRYIIIWTVVFNRRVALSPKREASRALSRTYIEWVPIRGASAVSNLDLNFL